MKSSKSSPPRTIRSIRGVTCRFSRMASVLRRELCLTRRVRCSVFRRVRSSIFLCPVGSVYDQGVRGARLGREQGCDQCRFPSPRSYLRYILILPERSAVTARYVAIPPTLLAEPIPDNAQAPVSVSAPISACCALVTRRPRAARSLRSRRPEWLGAALAAPQAGLPFWRESNKSQDGGLQETFTQSSVSR